MGMAAPNRLSSVVPKSSAQSLTSGSSAAGTSNRASNSSSQRFLAMSNSSVRPALVASVACTLPPVSRQMRKLSTVPKASSPFSARLRAPLTLSSSHLTLVPEK